MLGLALTTMISAIVAFLMSGLVRLALPSQSRATVFGLAGLLGLGVPALPLLAFGPDVGAIVSVVLLASAFGLAKRLGSAGISFAGLMQSAPKGLEWLAVLPALLGIGAGKVGALAPSLASDWDTIAYHLAVPKQWLADGAIHPVSFIHHSFFPSTVDALFMLGLQWGGQAGAKGFTLAYFIFGCLAIFGMAKDRYGKLAGLWALAAFATIPVAIWEAGTGYIDVAHGLYAGLGAWLVFQGMEGSKRGEIVLGGALLGLAAASKYTGLQALIGIGLVAIVLAMMSSRARQGSVLIAAALAIVIAAPWYVRNAVVSGNPVYPFFYERFGGKWWNQNQADIYRNEQKTFGVPFDGPLSVPHAILGLAYQPGRYINPGQKLQVVDGVPTGATGNELGATGMPIVAGLLAVLVFWRRLPGRDIDKADRPQWTEPAVLAWILVGLLMWAMLSQQSRYMLSFAPPICLMIGGLVAPPRKSLRWVALGLGVLIGIQGLWTGFLCKDRLLTPPRIRVALGLEDPKTYLQRGLGFYEAAEYLNGVKAKRVALFDEVFGFYLDVPYFWAGYGHTNEMNYEGLQASDEFVAKLKELGIDRIYVSFVFSDRAFISRWMGSMGLGDNPMPLPDEERAALMGGLESKWRVLLADAVLSGKIQLEKVARSGPIFRVVP